MPNIHCKGVVFSRRAREIMRKITEKSDPNYENKCNKAAIGYLEGRHKVKHKKGRDRRVKPLGLEVDYQARLVGLLLEVDKKDGYLYVIDNLPTHKYKYSKTLKLTYQEMLNIIHSPETQKDIEDHIANQNQIAEPKEKDIHTKQKKPVRKNKPYVLESIAALPVKCINNDIFLLNQAQVDVLHHSPLPLFCLGAARSGKSVLAFSFIEKMLDAGYGRDEKRPIYYVTQSPTLVAHLQKIWNKQATTMPYNVRFVTYEQLVREQLIKQGIVIKNDTFVTTDSCKKWITDKLAKYLDLNESQVAFDENNLYLMHPDTLYAELRLISGYFNKGDKDGYLSPELGWRKSPYSLAARKKLWKFYAILHEDLAETEQFHIPFTQLSPTLEAEFVAIDEFPDLSTLQIDELIALLKNKNNKNNLAIFGDLHQDESGQRPINQYIQNRIEKHTNKKIKPTYLTRTNQCSAEVVKTLNNMLELKLVHDGGISDEAQYTKVVSLPNDIKGEVVWFSPNNEKGKQFLNNLIERTKSSKDFAIVTLAEFSEEAKQFKAPIYTPGSIKGQHFKNVILYRMFDGIMDQEPLKEANQLIIHNFAANKGKKNLIPQHRIKEDFTPFPLLNKLIIALSRGIENIYGCQERRHEFTTIYDHLTASATLLHNVANKLPAVSANNDPKAWYKSLAKLVLEEHYKNSASSQSLVQDEARRFFDDHKTQFAKEASYESLVQQILNDEWRDTNPLPLATPLIHQVPVARNIKKYPQQMLKKEPVQTIKIENKTNPNKKDPTIKTIINPSEKSTNIAVIPQKNEMKNEMTNRKVILNKSQYLEKYLSLVLNIEPTNATIINLLKHEDFIALFFVITIPTKLALANLSIIPFLTLIERIIQNINENFNKVFFDTLLEKDENKVAYLFYILQLNEAKTEQYNPPVNYHFLTNIKRYLLGHFELDRLVLLYEDALKLGFIAAHTIGLDKRFNDIDYILTKAKELNCPSVYDTFITLATNVDSILAKKLVNHNKIDTQLKTNEDKLYLTMMKAEYLRSNFNEDNVFLLLENENAEAIFFKTNDSFGKPVICSKGLSYTLNDKNKFEIFFSCINRLDKTGKLYILRLFQTDYFEFDFDITIKRKELVLCFPRKEIHYLLEYALTFKSYILADTLISILPIFFKKMSSILTNYHYVLLGAIEFNQHRTIDYLFKLNLENELEPIEPQYFAPLHHAITHDRTSILKRLLLEDANRIDPNLRDSEGNSPLHFAVTMGRLEIVKLLLDKGLSPEELNAKQFNSLHLAIINNHEDIVKLLLDREMDPNIYSPVGCHSLHFATGLSLVSNKIINLILDKMTPQTIDEYIRIKTMSSNENRGNALYSVVEFKDFEKVKSMLTHGANPNLQTTLQKYTSLHLAAETNQVAILELLMQNGGDPFIFNIYHMTPFQVAIYNGNDEIIKKLLQFHPVSAFDISQALHPLILSIVWGKFTTLELIFPYFSQDLEITTTPSTTDFNDFIYTRNLKGICQQIKANELKKYPSLFNNWTPLHFAICCGDKEKVQFLLNHQVKINNPQSGVTIEKLATILVSYKPEKFQEILDLVKRKLLTEKQQRKKHHNHMNNNDHLLEDQAQEKEQNNQSIPIFSSMNHSILFIPDDGKNPDRKKELSSSCDNPFITNNPLLH